MCSIQRALEHQLGSLLSDATKTGTREEGGEEEFTQLL